MSWERVPGATIVRTTGSDEKIEGCGYRNLVSQKREEIFRLIARELSEWEGE